MKLTNIKWGLCDHCGKLRLVIFYGVTYIDVDNYAEGGEDEWLCEDCNIEEWE